MYFARVYKIEAFPTPYATANPKLKKKQKNPDQRESKTPFQDANPSNLVLLLVTMLPDTGRFLPLCTVATLSVHVDPVLDSLYKPTTRHGRLLLLMRFRLSKNKR